MILDLEDGVAYTSFLNSLKSGRFKFSLAEHKEITLAETVRKVVDFICPIKIHAECTDGPMKAKALVERNTGRGDRRPSLEVVDPSFTTDPRSILVALKKHPMLKRPHSMTSVPKPHNAWKYCEFHKQNGQKET